MQVLVFCCCFVFCCFVLRAAPEIKAAAPDPRDNALCTAQPAFTNQAEVPVGLPHNVSSTTSCHCALFVTTASWSLFLSHEQTAFSYLPFQWPCGLVYPTHVTSNIARTQQGYSSPSRSSLHPFALSRFWDLCLSGCLPQQTKARS